jgi:hypothetical protein
MMIVLSFKIVLYSHCLGETGEDHDTAMWWVATDGNSKLLPLKCMSKWQLFHFTSLSPPSSAGSCRRLTKFCLSLTVSSHSSSSFENLLYRFFPSLSGYYF